MRRKSFGSHLSCCSFYDNDSYQSRIIRPSCKYLRETWLLSTSPCCSSIRARCNGFSHSSGYPSSVEYFSTYTFPWSPLLISKLVEHTWPLRSQQSPYHHFRRYARRPLFASMIQEVKDRYLLMTSDTPTSLSLWPILTANSTHFSQALAFRGIGLALSAVYEHEDYLSLPDLSLLQLSICSSWRFMF